MRNSVRILLLFVLLASCSQLDSQAADQDEIVIGRPAVISSTEWPQIINFEKVFFLDLSADALDFSHEIKDRSGKTLYLFWCLSGGDDQVQKHQITLVAQVNCFLTEGGERYGSALLSEDGSAHWYSRGQINGNHLAGACASYPEYGLFRQFRLRGFVLTMKMSNPMLYPDGSIKNFELTLSGLRDKSATWYQSEQPGYLTPYKLGRSCEKVLEGNEVRMCRDFMNKGGSWTECDNLGW